MGPLMALTLTDRSFSNYGATPLWDKKNNNKHNIMLQSSLLRNLFNIYNGPGAVFLQPASKFVVAGHKKPIIKKH